MIIIHSLITDSESIIKELAIYSRVVSHILTLEKDTNWIIVE